MLDQHSKYSLCHLDTLGCIQLTGVDSVKFLQGQITINAGNIGEQELKLGAICNPQGRCVALFWATRRGEDIFLLQLRDTIQATIAHLSKYAVFFKTTITDSSAGFDFFGVLSDEPPTTPEEPFQADSNASLLSMQNPSLALIMVKAVETATFTEKCAPLLPEIDWFAHLAEKRVPWLTSTSINEFLPHNLDLPFYGGVDFKKGCFTGQEVIARMQYKGKLKSHMQQFLCVDTALPEPVDIPPKTKIFADDEAAGEVICATLDSHKNIRLLALIKDNSLSGKNFRLLAPNGPIMKLIPKP